MSSSKVVLETIKVWLFDDGASEDVEDGGHFGALEWIFLLKDFGIKEKFED